MSYQNPAEDAIHPLRVAFVAEKIAAERERLERKYALPVPYWFTESERKAAYEWQAMTEDEKMAKAGDAPLVLPYPKNDIGFSGVGIDGMNYHNAFRESRSSRRIERG